MEVFQGPLAGCKLVQRCGEYVVKLKKDIRAKSVRPHSGKPENCSVSRNSFLGRYFVLPPGSIGNTRATVRSTRLYDNPVRNDSLCKLDQVVVQWTGEPPLLQ